jgi:hypothetical protein
MKAQKDVNQHKIEAKVATAVCAGWVAMEAINMEPFRILWRARWTPP